MQYDDWFDVVRLVIAVKQGRRQCRIPVVDTNGQSIGRLEPISVQHLGDHELIRQFVRWRNQNLSGNLDQRPVTDSGTAKWLSDVVTNPTRIAFLMYAGDKLIGRCGHVQMRPWQLLSDGLVRGERGGGMRFMYYAQVACYSWTFRVLQIETVHATVLSTNEMAQENARSLGFDMNPIRSSPIYQKASAAGNLLEEHGLPSELVSDLTLDYYQLDSTSFFRKLEGTPGLASASDS